MYRYLAIGCAILSLAACCNCRTSIDAAELQQLTIGQTGEDDVKAKFGVPGGVLVRDNETTWTYLYNYEDQRFVNFIPIVGGVAGGPQHKNQNDTFVFDAQGKLKSYTRQDEAVLTGG